MNKDINQKISQFLDDELDSNELNGLLALIKREPELKNKINRYQSVTQAIQAGQAVKVDLDFLDKINQQLKQEPHYLLPKKVVKKHTVAVWQKASLAIAASVACVAVIMSQQNPLQHPQQLAVVDIPAVEQPVQQAKNTQPSQHERLKAYLQAHNDELYTHGSLNIHPLALTASYGRD